MHKTPLLARLRVIEKLVVWLRDCGRVIWAMPLRLMQRARLEASWHPYSRIDSVESTHLRHFYYFMSIYILPPAILSSNALL